MKGSAQQKKPFLDIASKEALERPTTVAVGEAQTEF